MKAEDAAAAIDNAVAHLNEELRKAAEAGLRVDVDLMDRREVIGLEDPLPPYISARCYKRVRA